MDPTPAIAVTLPASLQAATEGAGSGSFAVALSNGLLVRFTGVAYASGSEWLTLLEPTVLNGVASPYAEFPDGLDVRLDMIVWSATGAIANLTPA
jgi:hypothetical protein